LVFCLGLALCLNCTSGDDDDNDSGGAGVPRGNLIGIILDATNGSPVTEGLIRAILDTSGWTEVQTDENGVFILEDVPVASRLYLEFRKDDYCRMTFTVDTQEAEHSGQITDIVLQVFPADARLTVIVTGAGQFLAGLETTITSVSYSSKPASDITNQNGIVRFDAGMRQTYSISVPSFDLDGDGEVDLRGVSQEIEISSPDENLYIDLEPVQQSTMDLLSVGVDEIKAICLFSEPIMSLQVLSGDAANATLIENFPALMDINGHQVTLTPNVESGFLNQGDWVEFYVKAQGHDTETWWEGTIRYNVEGAETDDDADDDDDDTDDDDADAPQIFDPYWDPDPVAYDSDMDGWVSYLIFGVCDPDDDLSGGAIYAYNAGTTELIWSEPIYWDDFTSLPDVSDCEEPTQVGAGTIFSDGTTPPGWDANLCIDIEVSDGDGSFSNLETNICVYVP
jgi:hypothetical protein